VLWPPLGKTDTVTHSPGKRLVDNSQIPSDNEEINNKRRCGQTVIPVRHVGNPRNQDDRHNNPDDFIHEGHGDEADKDRNHPHSNHRLILHTISVHHDHVAHKGNGVLTELSGYCILFFAV